MTTLTGTIKNITFDDIFINSFRSLTCMHNFIDFHGVVFEIFSFFYLKKCEKKKREIIQILKSVIIFSSLIYSTHIFDCLFKMCNILLNQFKI